MCTALVVALFVSSSTLASHEAVPVIFFKDAFGQNNIVSLGLAQQSTSRDPAFDFDAVIDVSKWDETGTLLYFDQSRHLARIRCFGPATVRLRGVDYVIDTQIPASTDWKRDLWSVVCTSQVSRS